MLAQRFPFTIAILFTALIAATALSWPGPRQVSASGVTVSVAAGGDHTCALSSQGAVKCWGDNFRGQVGDGTHADRSMPVDVVGLPSGAAGVVAGQFHTCALMPQGTVKCWGWNAYGQLGGGTGPSQPAPVDVPGLTDIVALTAGANHTCALTSAGGVECWGRNAEGQIGDGTTVDRTTPVGVSGLASGVAAVSANGDHTCALTTGGGVKCWGRNDEGQVGDGTTVDRATPVNVFGLASGIAVVSAGYFQTCAVTVGGDVLCWGANGSGQLGDGTTTDRTTPGNVLGLPGGAGDVISGGNHTCAIVAGTGLWCWGWNMHGQVGDGTTIDRLNPVGVCADPACGSPLFDVLAAWAGYRHTCIVTIQRGAKCWGRNADGEVGDGTNVDRLTPVDVVGLDVKPPIATGDADCNGVVNAIDAALVLQFTAGLTPSLPCLQAADVNLDGIVDAVDAALILQFVAGLVPALPPP